SSALVLTLTGSITSWAGEDCMAAMGPNAANVLNTQPQKVVEACCRRVAAQGFGIGYLVLGFLYEHGFGVPLDYVTAWMWYDLGVGHGVTDGRGGDALAAVRDGLAKKMTPSQIEQAKALVAASKPTMGQ